MNLFELTHHSIQHLDSFMSNYVPSMKVNVSTHYSNVKLADLGMFDAGLVKLWIFMLENYSLNMVTIVLPFILLFLNYFIPSGLMWLVEWCDFEFLRKYKIQPKRKNSGTKMVKATFFLLFIYFLVILPMYSIGFHFLTQIDYFSLDVSNIPTWPTLLIQLAICFFLEDTAHYWFHRWLHTPWAYHHIHKIHHEFESPTILATSFAHPIEILILGFATFLGPLILRPHFLTLLLFVNLRQLAACETHSGFDFPFSPNNLAPNLIGGADFHDFHHRRCSGVFSSNFMWWDIWCGTCGGYLEWKQKKLDKKLA